MDKFYLFLFFTINTLITMYKQTIYSWQKNNNNNNNIIKMSQTISNIFFQNMYEKEGNVYGQLQ